MNEQKIARVRELAKYPAFLSEMQDVFFGAMNEGYATKPKKDIPARSAGISF